LQTALKFSLPLAETKRAEPNRTDPKMTEVVDMDVGTRLEMIK